VLALFSFCKSNHNNSVAFAETPLADALQWNYIFLSLFLYRVGLTLTFPRSLAMTTIGGGCRIFNLYRFKNINQSWM